MLLLATTNLLVLLYLLLTMSVLNVIKNQCRAILT